MQQSNSRTKSRTISASVIVTNDLNCKHMAYSTDDDTLNNQNANKHTYREHPPFPFTNSHTRLHRLQINRSPPSRPPPPPREVLNNNIISRFQVFLLFIYTQHTTQIWDAATRRTTHIQTLYSGDCVYCVIYTKQAAPRKRPKTLDDKRETF